MTSLVKAQIEIFFSIHPRHLANPSESIYTQLTQTLCKYSASIGGFPLTFDVLGVTPWGTINDDGSVYVNTLVEFLILKIEANDKATIAEGMLMNAFPCTVDGDEIFSGSFHVTKIEGSKIIGTVLESEF